MISLNITGDNAEDFASQVHGFVSLLNGTAPVALVANGGTAQATDIGHGSETERKSRSRKTKDADPTIASNTDPSATSSAPVDAAPEAVDPAPAADSSSETNSSPSVADEDATNIDKVKARAMAFAQKAGPAALVEMLVQAGAASGKFSEIVGNTTAIKLVSDALAAAGY